MGRSLPALAEAVLWDGGLGGAIVALRDSDNKGEAAPINSFSRRARAEQKEGASEVLSRTNFMCCT
jgi:hypothetical protein